MVRPVEFNPAEAFLRGAGLSSGIINANRRMDILEGQEARAQTAFDQDQYDRRMQRAVSRLRGLMLDPSTGEMDLNRVNAALTNMPHVLEPALADLGFDGWQVEGVAPSSVGHVAVRIRSGDQQDVLAEGNGPDARIIQIPTENLPAHVLGLMAQYDKDGFDQFTAQLSGNATDEELADFVVAGRNAAPSAASGLVPAQANPRAAVASIVADAAPVTAAAAPEPTAPPPAAPAPEVSTPPAQDRSVTGGLGRAVSSAADKVLDADIAPAQSLGNFTLRDAGRMISSAADAAAGKVGEAFDSVVEKTSRGLSAIADFGLEDPVAPTPIPPRKAKTPEEKVASQPPKPMPAKTNTKAKAVVSNRPPATKPPEERSMPEDIAVNVSRMDPRAAKANGMSDADLKKFVRTAARLKRKGVLTAEEFQTEVSRVLGRPVKVSAANGHIISWGADGQVLGIQELPMGAEARARLQLSELTAAVSLAKLDAATGKASATAGRQKQQDTTKAAKNIADIYAGTGKKQNRALHKWLTSGIPAMVADHNLDPNSPYLASVVGGMIAQVEEDRDGIFSGRAYNEYNLSDVFAASPFAGGGEPIGEGFDNLTPSAEVLAIAATRGLDASVVNDAIAALALRVADEENITPEEALAFVHAQAQRAPGAFLSKVVAGQ